MLVSVDVKSGANVRFKREQSSRSRYLSIEECYNVVGIASIKQNTYTTSPM